MVALFVIAGLGLSGPAAAQTHPPTTTSTPMSKDSYTMAKKNADAQQKIDNDACSSSSGNAKDVCLAEADGKGSIARAEAEAAYENTPKARESARVARAQARYDVAIEKCDDFAGNRKDVCVEESKAELVKGKADARVDRVTADTRREAAAKQADARKGANAEMSGAEYNVAIEKCDALAGPAKDACVSDAKLQYGKP
jgi:hypothetical protein